MSTQGSYYARLGIAPDASQAQIEQAYQTLVNELSARISAGNAPSQTEFDDLDTAFTTLRDPARRAAYDASLTNPASGITPPSSPPTASAPTHSGLVETRIAAFRFTGSGGEYFRIWIVNLLLSILTLGIYSAWAKVRREQYFHRNTLLDDSGFDYHAKPFTILKGRIVALILFAGVSVSGKISVTLYAISLLVLTFVMPWMLVRAYRFRARNTSYRGLRFQFTGTYGGAFKVFVGYGLLSIITLYIAAPEWVRQMRLYIVNHMHFGNAKFKAEVGAGQVYKLVLIPAIVLVAIVALIIMVASSGSWGALAFLPLLMIGVAITVMPYLKMSFNNLFWSNTQLDAHRFSSTMRFGRYFGIVFKNWLLTLLTLGLYWPWAHVSLVNYRASETRLEVHGSLDGFIASASNDSAAIGDEAAEMFDFDIGF